MIFATWILLAIFQLTNCNKPLEIENRKEFKKAVASHSNILVAFHENAARADATVLATLNEVADQSSKLARLLTVDCESNKKLCKHFKAEPRPLVIQHFHKGKFNKVYDRKLRVQTVLRFLEDPTGDIPWEEDDSAKNVVHVTNPQALQKIVDKFKTNIPPIMIMFYAPWCGYCKKMKPEFSAAATSLKGKSVFIGINGDLPSTDDLKQVFNVTGYPSVFLIQDGNKVFKYDNEISRDALMKFVHQPSEPAPQKTVPWSEETQEIDFLTDSNFEEYIHEHESVLVMFYAPWCGHCKTMKPEVIEAAVQLRKIKIDGVIAAIDATENKNVSQFFGVQGFPTLKYFKAGQYMYDVHERSADGLINFFRNPQPPSEPAVEVLWKDEKSAVLHPSPEDFKGILKRFKHTLVMFYAPWCGHCKSTKPAFTAAANRMQDNARAAFVAVDCTDMAYSAICTAQGVTGFPTLRYFNYGKNTSHSVYTLERDEDAFVGFMTNPTNPRLDARRYWRKIPRNQLVAMLETENFTEKVIGHKGGALVMFYSPWCRNCAAMKPEFVSAAITLEKSLPSCLLGAVDVTSETFLASQHKITSFPTLIYFSPDGKWQVYIGGKKDQDIVDFMIKKNQEWMRAEENKIAEERKIKEENAKKVIEEQKVKERAKEEKIKNEKEAEEKRIREEREKKEAEERERKQVEEKRIREKREKEEAEERRIKIDKEKKEAEDKERKHTEEMRIREEREKKEAKEKERKQAEEKRIREEREKKEADEKERKQAEEKRIREEREMKEANEKARKQAEEKKIREEREIKEAEEKRMSIEKEKKEAEDKARKQAEKVRIREEMEKKEAEEKERKEAEEKRVRDEREKKEAEEKIIKEEREKKEAEEKRVKVEREKKEEKERKQAEEKRIKEEREKKVAEEDERKQSEENKIRDPEDKISSEGRKGSPELVVLGDEASVEAHSRGERLSVFYLHRAGQKNTVKTKLLKVLVSLSRSSELPSSFEVDCDVIPSLCDRLHLTELPVVMVYSHGSLRGSLVGRWDEASLHQLLTVAPPREDL